MRMLGALLVLIGLLLFVAAVRNRLPQLWEALR